MTVIKRSIWARFSVGGRLLLINALLLVALTLVAFMSWRSNDAQRKAMTDLALISRAARYHQDADTQNANLRADVSAALGSASFPALSHDAVLGSLVEDSDALQRDIRSLDRLELPPDLAESFGRVRELTDAYRAQANETTKAIISNPNSGVALMPPFNAAFEALQQAMLQQTGVLARRIIAADEAADAASQEAKRWLLTTTILTGLTVCGLVAVLSSSIRRSLRRVRDVARAIAGGDLAARADANSSDEVGSLARAMNQLADNLSGMMDRLRLDAERDAFGTKLVQALEMADSEAEAYAVVSHVMKVVAADMPMELLVADSSRAHLEHATQHPSAGRPGCSVESPFSCVAVRRGAATTFTNSDEVNACPRLRGRPGGAVSAVCIPLSFMGRSMGVLHAAGPANLPASDQMVAQLSNLAHQTASRVGTLRAFRRTQIQASTDSLTGLMNRRTLEEHIRTLSASGRDYAFVLCDLDHFKKLNDTHGHEAGDQALRLFADVLRSWMRDDDMPCRWGGEEFVLILAGCSAAQALEAVERLRTSLAQALLAGSAPAFTASFGIADTSMGLQLDQLARMADEALYQAKEAGRNRAVIANGMGGAQAVPRRGAEHLAEVDLNTLGMGSGESEDTGSFAPRTKTPALQRVR
jgi:diguanylate cyclase (GGDEF)-like protein